MLTNQIYNTIFSNDINSLIITKIPDTINKRINSCIENQEKEIYNEWKNSFWNTIFNTIPDMNSGIYKSIFFDENTKLDSELEYIKDCAYILLKDCGFNIIKDCGMFHFDIFDMNTLKKTQPHYIVSTDNYKSNYNVCSCMFYTRKDSNVDGDFEYYENEPSIFTYKFMKKKIATESCMAILRNGELYYKIEDHSGYGKEYIISVHFKSESKHYKNL
jgi:hypothetical protein